MENLKSYKVNIGGTPVALFDISGTVLAGYVLGKYMDWDVKKTIPSMFVGEYLFHNMIEVSTPLNDKINESLHIPINNPTNPVGLKETRFSTM